MTTGSAGTTDLGRRIREIRKARGMTMEQVSKSTAMSLNGYGDIERGAAHNPHINTLMEIAEVLDVTIFDLLGDPSSPKAAAPTSSQAEERRYPYPWMLDTLAETLARWHDISLLPGADPKDSYLAANGCFAVLQSVLRFDVPGKTLADRVPAEELEERKKFAEWLGDIAERASKHYADSQEAAPAEVASLEEYRSRLRAV